MITVEEALAYIEKSEVKILGDEVLPLESALNRVLSSDVLSPIQMPPFPQSAMDGYAVNFNSNHSIYNCVGEIAAGQKQNFSLKQGEAVRIFTGAMVPETANMVIRQEDVIRDDDCLTFTSVPKIGSNIRPTGEQIRAGEVALEKGVQLTSAGIGFLTALGIQKVSVHQTPRIAIISTGNELKTAGEHLEPCQIYESNGQMLQSALLNYGFSNTTYYRLGDNYKDTLETVKILIAKYDLLIFSGGISVGDYDYVGKGLTENGVQEIFYKVKQKPGKPIYYGQKNGKIIFALPGNPAACQTCFLIYVLPVLSQMIGLGYQGLTKLKGQLNTEYIRKGDRAQFLKAFHDQNGKLEILDGQSSAMLKSFAVANALVYIPIDQSSVDEGEPVSFYLL